MFISVEFCIQMLNGRYCRRFDAIFYTGGQSIDERILRQHVVPYGSYVSTVPEQLISDSLGPIFGSIFAGCVRLKLLVQVHIIERLVIFILSSVLIINCVRCSTCLALICNSGKTDQKLIPRICRHYAI